MGRSNQREQAVWGRGIGPVTVMNKDETDWIQRTVQVLSPVPATETTFHHLSVLLKCDNHAAWNGAICFVRKADFVLCSNL
jgi:hypothetical protein